MRIVSYRERSGVLRYGAVTGGDGASQGATGVRAADDSRARGSTDGGEANSTAGLRIVDLSSRLAAEWYGNIVAFIGGGDAARDRAREIVEREPGDVAYDDVELTAVVPNPGKIVCVGLNYREHIDEAEVAVGNLKVTELPMIFARWPESLTGHRRPILRPRASETLDYEAELLAVIGRTAGRYLPEERALEHVFGYACMNEACVRAYQRHSSQITPGKNFEQTGATGPWIVTADDIPDPTDLDIELRLNGETMQHANTRLMKHSVAEIIAYVTRFTPLHPGDLIATGTMGGVGFARTPPIYLKPGDVAEVTIGHIGTLRNVVEDEPIPRESS